MQIFSLYICTLSLFLALHSDYLERTIENNNVNKIKKHILKMSVFRQENILLFAFGAMLQRK